MYSHMGAKEPHSENESLFINKCFCTAMLLIFWCCNRELTGGFNKVCATDRKSRLLVANQWLHIVQVRSVRLIAFNYSHGSKHWIGAHWLNWLFISFNMDVLQTPSFYWFRWYNSIIWRTVIVCCYIQLRFKRLADTIQLN